MNFLKSYIRPGASPHPRASNPEIQITPSVSITPSTVPSKSPPTQRSSSYGAGSRTSIHPAGDFRNNGQREIDEIKSTVAISWVFQLQGENMWNNQGPGEGVVLRKAHGEFIACPADLASVRGGLFEAAEDLNVKVSKERLFSRIRTKFHHSC